MEQIELAGPAYRLTPPTRDDVEDITEACQDPEVSAWVTVPAPYVRAHAETFIDSVVVPGWVRGNDLVWAIRARDRTSGERGLVGMVGLHGIADGSAEVGYWVAPWGRGRGAAGAAVQLVSRYAFEGMDLVRLSWHAYVGNWPSRRVAWRAGFRVEGTIRLQGVQRGERVDSWVGTLLAEDPRSPAEPWPAHAPPGNVAGPVPGSRRPVLATHERMQP